MDTLAPGSTLSQYQIIDKIAAGGFGTVYRALHLNMQREVALKVLLPNLSEDKVFVERFKREAQATAALRHPHIVEIYDANSVGERYFLAMEYLPGGNLQARLAQLREQRKLMPLDEALRITRQIASALDYAHAKGFVHRDIKPSNILIDRDDRYVLTDFGIVSAQDARTKLTMNSAALGTPEYMAPEQAQGKAPDARSDIYALGVVLYEMLAGIPPFTADTPWGIVYKHIKEPPPPIARVRPELPASVKAVLDRSMAKDPAARYQTAAQMVAAIDVALGKTTSTRRKGLPVGVLLGGVLGLIALIAFAFAGITFLSNNASNPSGASAIATPAQAAAIVPVADKPTATQVVAVTEPATDAPAPTVEPTTAPSVEPTVQPTSAPTESPSATPTTEPTTAPTVAPTAAPTQAPAKTAPPAPTPFPSPTPQAAAPTAAPAAPAADSNAGGAPKAGQLINFEQNLNWRRGNQPYGTLARSNEQVHDGRYAAKLSYDFPGVADNFVVFETSLKLAPNATGLSAWVYGDGSGHFLNVWLEDGSGQVRQQTFGRVSHTGWKQMVAWFYTDARKWPANSHISGPDAGSLTPPYTLKALVLDGVPDGAASSGAIFIDEVYQMTQAIPAGAPTAAPVAQATPQAGTVVTDLPVIDVTATPESPFAGVQVGVEQNRASYRQWGRQVSADSCNTNDALGATYKFDFVLTINNGGMADLLNMRGYFVGEDGRRLILCGVLPDVPIGSTARTPLNTFADLWVRQFVLLDNRGEVISRVCFSRPVGAADVVVVGCG